MSGQLDINGNVQPVTWDGEPVYSPETVAEGLFDGGAFEQMKGQLAVTELICPVTKRPCNVACYDAAGCILRP